MSETTQETDRLSWPRRVEDGTPIVGWVCRHCGHEIEHAHQPSLLRRCPNCGGNSRGVRGFDVEPFVEERRERLRDQLAERYGLRQWGDDEERECEVCGAAKPSVDPGENLDDFSWRCPEHRRFEYKYWWQPGDHPSLLVRDWIETCEDCGAEFTGIFGVTYWFKRRRREDHTTCDVCLQCVNVEKLRYWLDVTVEGGSD